MKILVVEDNPRLAERIHRHASKHHAVDLAVTGDDALNLLKQHSYDLLVLDLNLPDMHGGDICSYLRKQKNDTPILVVSGLDAVATKVDLLTLGADDYLTKPFNSEELLARITAVGRRHARQPPQQTITYRDLIINVDRRSVHRGDEPIILRRKEFDILVYLLSNQGRVLTREMIMNHAWDGNKISWKSTVDVHIKHLRDKLSTPTSRPIIHTAYGLGYTVEIPIELHKERIQP